MFKAKFVHIEQSQVSFMSLFAQWSEERNKLNISFLWKVRLYQVSYLKRWPYTKMRVLAGDKFKALA